MSFCSLDAAFQTSMDTSPRNPYMVPDVFEITSKNFFQPNLSMESIRNTMSFPEAAPNPEEGLMRENFGNVEQQFPKEFYEADMKARHLDSMPQFEEQLNTSHPSGEEDYGNLSEYVRECEARIQSLEAELREQRVLDLPEHMVNAIIYIITGIFILFLLDIFVKLGKMLH